MGASAGGLAALEALLSAILEQLDCPIAFAVVQHLDPHHKSLLVELLARQSKLQLVGAEAGMLVEPSRAYVIPPNRDMTLRGGSLWLTERIGGGPQLPIDTLFRSMAEALGEHAIGVVLSGTGTDGTLGLEAIKQNGGLAMAQTPESAMHDGMPRSAIATGVVDFVLPPDEMPAHFLSYAQRSSGAHQPMDAARVDDETAMKELFVRLRAQTGHDFACYKPNTVQRRIARRMAVTQTDTLTAYVARLREDNEEIAALFRDLLIGVTSFFRDPEVFAVLETRVIPDLLRNKPPGASVRVWVPACSTGEEAYSLAMLLHERADVLHGNRKIQVFATDIDAEAIARARAGAYPDTIEADVSPERLARFFTRVESTYQIRKSVRDMVVFAKQDVLRDPPFSKMDLISCRNLLIYLDTALQKKLMPLFYYALNPHGHLLLGSSESVGDAADLFSVVDKTWKLYACKHGVPREASLHVAGPAFAPCAALECGAAAPASSTRVREVAERFLLEQFVPSCVVVDADFQVVYIHGRTGQYLEPAEGEASLSLPRMAREGLRMELTTALRKASSEQQPVRCNGLRVRSNGDTRVVNLIVQPVPTPSASKGLLMVLFEESLVDQAAASANHGAPSSDADPRIADLERQLRSTDEYVQASIEELETANEELKSTNEELQSTNEELQSTNEELETSKEELQSVNEELITVNSELETKLAELSRVNSDMNNLLASTGIGTIFVDHTLSIRRFTPSATKIVHLIATDVGRPVSDLMSRLTNYDTLVADVRGVLDTLAPKEAEVQSKDGTWYLMRILPYRTVDNVIDGAVLTFVDISGQVELRSELEKAS